MEKQLKTRGIVIRRIDLGEADQIITLLSEDQGKISLLAKGSKRLKSKFLGKLELLSEIHATYFQGRELGYLNEVESRPLLQEKELDLMGRSFLFYMAEVTHKLIADHQECRSIYLLLRSALNAFEKRTSAHIFYGYLVKLLTSLGFMASWEECPKTHEKLDLSQTYFLSLEDGSISTEMNATSLHLSPPLIKWVNYMQKEGFEKLIQVQVTEAEKGEVFFILKSILGTILNQNTLKSEAFMRTA